MSNVKKKEPGEVILLSKAKRTFLVMKPDEPKVTEAHCSYLDIYISQKIMLCEYCIEFLAATWYVSNKGKLSQSLLLGHY